MRCARQCGGAANLHAVAFSARFASRVPNAEMARTANRVFTGKGDIDRIESLAVELPSHARVRITLRNGDAISGTVCQRPAAQLFEDAAGNRGINAIVRLADPNVPVWDVYLWLGDIDRIETLALGVARRESTGGAERGGRHETTNLRIR
jgi:hypothetical protein